MESLAGPAYLVKNAGRVLLLPDDFTGIERLAISSSNRAGFRAQFAALVLSVDNEGKLIVTRAAISGHPSATETAIALLIAHAVQHHSAAYFGQASA